MRRNPTPVVIGMSFSEKYGSTITMVWTRSGYHGNGMSWWELPNNGNGSLPLPCVLWVMREGWVPWVGGLSVAVCGGLCGWVSVGLHCDYA